MAMESVSLPRDNSLEELRVAIEEKKQEAKEKFSELKKLLQISEDSTTTKLDKIYTDIREGVVRNERTVTQLEQAKIALSSTLVDNNTTLFLQATIRNIDSQIAEARNSACVVPKHILLRWNIEDLKQYIENVCEVISSSTPEIPVSTRQTDKIELEGMRKKLEQRTNELISLQKEKQDMQEKYQNEISNSKSCVESLNKECSLLKIELEKKGGDSQHNFNTNSADTEEHTQSLTTRISELEGTLTTKDTYISHLCVELENIRIHYSNLEKKLESSKSINQPSSRDESQHLYSNTISQKIPDTRISQLLTKVTDLEMQFALKNSECEDLQKKIASLKSELKEAQDLLASNLESLNGSDVDDVIISKKQIEELEADKQDLIHTISFLQNHIDSKEKENAILRNNLDDSMKELENTRFQLQHTQQSNPTKVQSKEDLQTRTVVKEKQAQCSQVVTKHKQQRKYNITDLRVNGEYSHFYTLNQVDDPSDFIGELVVCRSKSNFEFVIGTLKVVIPAKLKHDKTIAGIEFIDKFGDCYGSYRGISYFKTKSKCALFIPTDEVYIGYNQSPK